MEQNGTAVRMVFESSTVYVEKEELAYDIETFVADLGGVLGLFVGFNFLMIWDGILQALTFFKQKLTYTQLGSTDGFCIVIVHKIYL